ncbi:glycoside hydrolase family 115 protein [Botryobasidium botryosum FD-172 SS1]|uniref:Glycoside hydrolase family 115 protein n=1 Tax=Botryobasidium botryosum (strain FD-172 SS1) TaxID=930990 RepID=A0A067M8R5_BOTB1|nr:glycoside hydrolase family 115 protein [Botryobasidium botryosum FD-172 SS1]
MRLGFLLPLASALSAAAIGQSSCVSFDTSKTAFPVVSGGKASPILVGADDWAGVQRAANDFKTDISRVTGKTPQLQNVSTTLTDPFKGVTTPIIIGTLGKSSLIKKIVDQSKIDVSSLTGKWESYVAQQITQPINAYVIIGSDKRGTIYGLYELSEQFGVSPWYWWADVPVVTHNSLFLTGTCQHGPPTIKYRGIFLNDEQPGLQSWAQEKFTNGTGAPFNSKFYGNLFELLLRLKANYLWPGMWQSKIEVYKFAMDDPQNQPLADLYGIVMGTSHQEPMARSTPNEWNIVGHGDWNFTTNAANISNYWTDGVKRAKPYETMYTLGMRGSGDLPLEEETNIALLEKVVDAQRQIFSNVYNTSDVTQIPQLWCLCASKDGMRVPDDVVLLWADDNWGNIRRFPIQNERNRTGGAGVYYHFDYVGDPRNYKWITSTQVSKVYEQMSLAHERGADKVWIVNVGDLKPYELNTEFFISLGYNITRFAPNNLDQYVSKWATREFQLPAKSDEIAAIVANVTRWNARRKPEMLNTTIYSLTDYREADTVLAAWKNTFDRSKAIYDSLPSKTKAAYFELVHHAVSASYINQNTWISAGLNNLYASQARLSTNNLADQVQALFESDYDLEDQYHKLLSGKWNHILDQTHIGYYYWQQPMANTMPAVNRIQARKEALAGAMRISLEGSRGAWPGDNPYQCSLGYNCGPPSLPQLDPFVPKQTRYIDVAAGGPNSFTFTVSSNVPWTKLSLAKGSISPKAPEQRIEVGVDWSKVPSGTSTAAITITGTTTASAKTTVVVYLTVVKTAVPSTFKGFVEGDGGVAIEANHASRNKSANGIQWTLLPGYGKTDSAVTPLPGLGNTKFAVGAGPSLEYDFYTFNSKGGSVTLTSYLAPSLNANGNDRPLAFAVQIDQETPQSVAYVGAAPSGSLPAGWTGLEGPTAVNIIKATTTHKVAPGAHTLKIWMIEPAVVLQRLVIDTGNVRPSYLGPPESIRV